MFACKHSPLNSSLRPFIIFSSSLACLSPGAGPRCRLLCLEPSYFEHSPTQLRIDCSCCLIPRTCQTPSLTQDSPVTGLKVYCSLIVFTLNAFSFTSWLLLILIELQRVLACHCPNPPSDTSLHRLCFYPLPHLSHFPFNLSTQNCQLKTNPVT